MEYIYSRKNTSDDLQTISFDSVTDEIYKENKANKENKENKENTENTDLTHTYNIFSKYICCLFYKKTTIKRQE